MRHLENDEDRMSAARNRTAVDVWYGLVAALLQLDGSARYSCRNAGTGRRLLLTEKSTEAQKRHIDFVVRAKQSSGYYCTATGNGSAYLYVTLRFHIQCAVKA